MLINVHYSMCLKSNSCLFQISVFLFSLFSTQSEFIKCIHCNFMESNISTENKVDLNCTIYNEIK